VLVRARLGGVALMLLTAACTSALNEPPPVIELAGAPAPPEYGGDVAALIAAAEAELAHRPHHPAVESARDLFLRALAADEPPVEAFLGAARATAWLVQHDQDPGRRKDLATEGVQIAQLCRDRFPAEPECRYRLALALGQQARERPSTAVDGLDVMAGLLRDLTGDAPALDFAGADRVLALVLLRAPGWPTGPGDPDSGLDHAVAAAEAFPDYPPNQLVLGEALLAAGRVPEGRAAFERALALAEPLAARGEPEAPEWIAEARRALDESHDGYSRGQS
jgi:tetratricopeptide (TPR) repeat protein